MRGRAPGHAGGLHPRSVVEIVDLRLPIARIEGKRKMSRNRTAEDRAGVAAGLAVSGWVTDHEMAVWTQT
jgi:transcriptional regulator